VLHADHLSGRRPTSSKSIGAKIRRRRARFHDRAGTPFWGKSGSTKAPNFQRDGRRSSMRLFKDGEPLPALAVLCVFRDVHPGPTPALYGAMSMGTRPSRGDTLDFSLA